MKTLSLWNPVPELEKQRQRMEEMLRTGRGQLKGGRGGDADWAPCAEIVETDRHLVIELDLPGVPEAAIDLQVRDGRLLVQGERREDSSNPAGCCRRSERTYGTFARSFLLLDGLEVEAMRAECEQGVLRVSIPKRAEQT